MTGWIVARHIKWLIVCSDIGTSFLRLLLSFDKISSVFLVKMAKLSPAKVRPDLGMPLKIILIYWFCCVNKFTRTILLAGKRSPVSATIGDNANSTLMELRHSIWPMLKGDCDIYLAKYWMNLNLLDSVFLVDLIVVLLPQKLRIMINFCNYNFLQLCWEVGYIIPQS